MLTGTVGDHHDNEPNSSSSSSSRAAGDDDALIQLMADEPRMTALISAYLNERQCSRASTCRDNHLLHVAAKHGCVADLRRLVTRDDVDVLNSELETPLHLAAEFEHERDVTMLLEMGASAMRADRHGCTALHAAALAISPSAAIAHLLVDSATATGDNFRLLNERSGVESGRNTALHVAAGLCCVLVN